MKLWKTSLLASAFTLSLGATAFADAQPHMRTALEQLSLAEKALETASHDKGTHRVKALQLIKEAIDQVKKGIAADNKTETPKESTSNPPSSSTAKAKTERVSNPK